MTATIPGAITPLPRGPTSKHADFAFTRPTSSQIRHWHSPPRSFNASPPYRQQAPPASTPPSLARVTGVPPTAPRALRQYMSSHPIDPRLQLQLLRLLPPPTPPSQQPLVLLLYQHHPQ